MYDEIDIMSYDTGFDRDYEIYPYGNFKEDHDLIAFPIGYSDERLENKERVHGVIVENKVKVYRLSDF